MRVLVLGADGMLGHEMVRTLIAAGHQVVATTRRQPDTKTLQALDGVPLHSNVDARVIESVTATVGAVRPDAVINCVGIVKQRPEGKEALESIRVNSLFPHELRMLCRAADAYLLHISTDCVFSGTKGSYAEDDMPDPIDLYGRTKLLGEVSGPGCLTLRTSIIGLELNRGDSLVEWFLRQTADVRGWTRAFYSGLTTIEFSRLIVRLLDATPQLEGLWHVSSEPISKYELLVLLRDMVGRSVNIRADDTVSIDRTLDSGRFRAKISYEPPAWPIMIKELAMAVEDRDKSLRVRR